MENPNAGELPVEKAPAGTEQPVETKVQKEVPLSLTPEQAESMAKALEEATALAEKKALEAENYKKGMLKAKGKLTEKGIEFDEDEKPGLTEERVAEIIRNELQAISVPKDDEIKTLRTTNSELINALRNRPTPPTSTGANVDKAEPSAHPYWSPEQLADLKRRGLDPDVVYRNMNATGAPGSIPANPVPTK